MLKEKEEFVTSLYSFINRIYSGGSEGSSLKIYMEFRKMVTITLCTRQQKRH